MGCNKRKFIVEHLLKKSWDGRRMPPLQNDKKIRQANQIPFVLPAIGVVLPEKQDMIDNSMDFHVEIVKKIDTLLREHEKKIILEELVSAQQPTLFPEEPSVEIRSPLSKKAKTPMFQLEKKQETSFYKKLTMPDEFKTEFLMIHNPSFKFVSSLYAPEDVLRIKNPEDKHVEVIDLRSLATNAGAVQKKVEVIETKIQRRENSDNVFSAEKHDSEKDSEKAKIYYLKSKNPDEKKSNELEKKQSYIPVDFEDKIKKLKEKEQREQEEEEKRLKKLETKKAKLEEKQKKKEEKKMLLKKLKKEAEEKKLLKTEAKKVEEESFEQLSSKKEEKKRKKLEAKQARLEAKQKKKEEKEALVKTLVKESEGKKQLKKKEKHMESEEVKADDLPSSIVTKKEQTFVDDDVIKVLLMTDDLLGNLPEEVIDKFAHSEDFKLYEKVISKYKTK